MALHSPAPDGGVLGVCWVVAVADILVQDSVACGTSWGFAFVGAASSSCVSIFRRLRGHRELALRHAAVRRRIARSAWFIFAEVIESVWGGVWRARVPADWARLVLCASSTCRLSHGLLWSARALVMMDAEQPGIAVQGTQSLVAFFRASS